MLDPDQTHACQTADTPARRRWLPPMGIRSKLTLMVGGPVVILLLIMSTQLSQRLDAAHITHELTEMVPFVEQASDVVHQIQKERGLSAIVLGTGEHEFGDLSDGKYRRTDFPDRLDAQYRKTDTSVAALAALLGGAVAERETFLETLTLPDGTAVLDAPNPLALFPNLASLTTHRQSVASLTVSETDNLTFYSSINEELLTFAGELNRWAPDRGIVDLIWAHNSMARATEAAGLERAVLGHAIAAGNLSRDQLAFLTGLIGSQARDIDMFLQHAPKDRKDEYFATFANASGIEPPPYGAATLVPYRDAGLANTLETLDAGQWWAVATRRIGMLDTIEIALLEDVANRGLLLEQIARTNLIKFAVFGIVALFGVAVAWGVGGRLARRLRSLTAVATAISGGDFARRADTCGGDELGTLGTAFNNMADHLLKMIDDKDQFIATVSHELRTPLTTVIGYAELLRSNGTEFTPDDRAEMVGAIAREAAELDDLIQDLLVAARSEDGSLVVATVHVDLTAQAAQVLETLDPDTAEAIGVVGDSPAATGDPMRVRQILRNLVSNALKYGGPQITVEIRNGAHDVTILVRDNGAGIPENQRNLMFTPYETLRAAGTIPGSMGLGLAVSRTLARLMEGDLTYRYEHDESLFELTLPQWAAPEPNRR